MPNEEYQRLLRADAAELRRRLEVVADDLEDEELLHTFRDLGGHDLGALLDGYRQADAVRDRPSRRLRLHDQGLAAADRGPPGEPLRAAQRRAVRAAGRRRWAPTRRTRGRRSRTARRRPSCARARRSAWRGRRAPPAAASPRGARRPRPRAQGHRLDAAGVRALLRRPRARGAGGRRARGHRLARRRHLDQPRRLDQQGRHLESVGDRIDWFADDTDTLVRWRETDHGRHIELGIAEVNLVGLLGELGATWSRDGQPLLPVGTIYDPFVARALEPWSFGIYAGGQSILVGTPSGVTLGPEGGAHQSVITPSIGIEQPGCTFWEPAFGQDLEWTFLHALSRLGREDGEAAYFRLSTRPLDQSLHERHARGGAERRLPAAPGRRPARGDRGDGRARARGGRGGGHPAQGGRRRGRGRLHHERRPALPLVPGARRAGRGRPGRRSTGCSRTTRR